MAPVSSADEVGDRGDVVTLGDANDPPQKRSAEQEHQRRSEVDRQKVPAAAGRASDRSVERPRSAVNAQREAVDPRLARRGTDDARATVPEVGNRKQYCDVTR